MQVRTALEVHAKQLGTSLVDLVRGMSVALHAGAAHSAHAAAPASQRLTPSRHASFVRAAVDAAPQPGSPASCASADAVAVALPDVVTDSGDAPTMPSHVRAPSLPRACCVACRVQRRCVVSSSVGACVHVLES